MKRNAIIPAVVLLLVAATAWGGMFPVAKATLPRVDAFWMTSIRYGIASLIFVGILAAVEGRRALGLEGRGLRLALLGATGFAGFGLFAFEGLAHSGPEHAAIIMAAQPLIAALVTWASRGLRPSRPTLVGIAVALAGVVLVISRGRLDGLLAGGSAYGDFLVLLGAVSWVVYTLGAGAFPGWSPLRYTALTCLLGVPSIFAATAVATALGAAHAASLADVAAVGWQLGYIIAIASVAAVLAWNVGNKRLGSATGMLFINFVPVTAFTIGILQGHRLDGVEFLGAALVIGALVTNTLLLRSPAAAAAAAKPVKLCESVS